MDKGRPMTPKADGVARAVLTEFNKLPSKRKPSIRDNGLHEWVPLSGIVAEQDGSLNCLALATGMKCLPASKIPESKGIVLHDWHAEILAVRTFNRYLLEECHSLVKGGSSKIMERNGRSLGTEEDGALLPFRVRDEVKLHMYCSEAPCGDASMELTMAAQDDATPWEVTPLPTPGSAGQLSGREFFSQLGVVRRKPGRRDAPPTLSKSCSDKLALKQCTSLLSGLTSLLIEPHNAYIDSLVLPQSQYSQTGCQRAFSPYGRMNCLQGSSWPGGYSFKPFKVEVTDLEFCFSKKYVSERAAKISASNVSAAWSCSEFEEGILGGVLQGRKPTDIRGASRMSRRRMWIAARDLARELYPEYDTIHKTLHERVYEAVKRGHRLKNRREVRADVLHTALYGWIENQGDWGFQVDPE